MIDRFINVFAIIAGVLLAFQFLSISLDVLLRYFFDNSFSWVIYSNEWSLFYITFLGAAWLQREKGHVRMDLLFAHMGKHLKNCIELLSDVMALVTGAILLWVGCVRTMELFHTNAYDFFKVDYVPLYLIYIVAPIGSFFLCLQSLSDLAKRVGARPDKHKSD